MLSNPDFSWSAKAYLSKSIFALFPSFKLISLTGIQTNSFPSSSNITNPSEITCSSSLSDTLNPTGILAVFPYISVKVLLKSATVSPGVIAAFVSVNSSYSL